VTSGPALAGYCRIRSYLTSDRNHGVTAIDAIHTALLGRPGYQHHHRLNITLGDPH
jgi:hypothetical protein